MTERIFAVAHWADQMVLVLLLMLSVLSIILIIERFFVLKSAAAQSMKSRELLVSALASKDLSAIQKTVEQNDSLETKAYELAMEKLNRGSLDGVHELFASVGALEKPRLEKSLAFLATVGSNAPYIGLFGTVLGIMKAFNDMATSPNGQQSVMAGISAALIATAAGLLVAIPAVLAYNYFQRQVKLIMTNLDTFRDVFIAWAKDQEGRHGSSSGK